MCFNVKGIVFCMNMKQILSSWLLLGGLLYLPGYACCGIINECQSSPAGSAGDLLPKNTVSSVYRSLFHPANNPSEPDTNKTNQIKQDHAGPLNARELTTVQDIRLSMLKGDRKSVSINWQCASQEGNKGYELQRSGNGELWQTIYSRTLETNGEPQADFAYLDQDPESPISYYRLLIKKNEGDDQVSDVIPVSFSEYSSMSVSPNPARTYAALHVYAVREGKGEIQVLDKKGRLRCHEAISVKEGENEFYLQLLRKLPKGMYTVRVVLADDVLTNSLIVLK